MSASLMPSANPASSASRSQVLPADHAQRSLLHSLLRRQMQTQEHFPTLQQEHLCHLRQ
jgi:hypothetical protein